VQSARQILHQIQKISNTQDGQKIALYLEKAKRKHNRQ
jgi:hypothetical protein